MRRPAEDALLASRRSVVVALAGIAATVALLAAAVAGAGIAGAPSTEVFHSVDRGLCPFSLDVRVARRRRTEPVGDGTVQVLGPTVVTLRNTSTGRTAVIHATGSASLDTKTGSERFSGRQVWLAPENHVPYLSTNGRGSRLAPRFVIAGAGSHTDVIDPCALVAGSPPSTEPVTTEAPWRLPAFALSQIEYAGLTPIVGTLIRHDHVHLDVIVDGKRITIPAGVGQAEPVDVGPGPCPVPPAPTLSGDCAPGHFFSARVALSPLHPHSTSGIIHVESDRPGTFTLGQFFDEWGVRLDSACLGGYCSGHGKELRVYVNGQRRPGDPRKVVLTDHQEIALVFGSRGTFGSVPSRYPGRWPGRGCGGAGEASCFP